MKLNYLILFISLIYCTTLQEAYENASPFEEYDKYIVLEPNTVYMGGIGIYEGNVYLNCMESTEITSSQ